MRDKKDQDANDQPDLASRLTDDHHQSLKLWLRMLSCTVRIENEIRSRLREDDDPRCENNEGEQHGRQGFLDERS